MRAVSLAAHCLEDSRLKIEANAAPALPASRPMGNGPDGTPPVESGRRLGCQTCRPERPTQFDGALLGNHEGQSLGEMLSRAEVSGAEGKPLLVIVKHIGGLPDRYRRLPVSDFQSRQQNPTRGRPLLRDRAIPGSRFPATKKYTIERQKGLDRRGTRLLDFRRRRYPALPYLRP
jgi:hypothetical protein